MPSAAFRRSTVADYLDHAVALIERERVAPQRPSLADVRDYLRGAPLTNWADTARRFAVMPAMQAKDHKAYLRALLYPARLVYSWTTGRMASNDDAVAFLRVARPPGVDVGLVVQALACRQADDEPTALFQARAALARQVQPCAACLA